MSKHLRLAHSADPIPGTVSPKKHKPISHVAIRANHPCMSVYDQDAGVSDDEAMYALELVIRAARDSGKPDLHLAAQVASVWVRDQFQPKGRGA